MSQPKVFIVYSHDSNEHQAWVRKLAERLRHDGLSVTYDQDQRGLGELARFMEDSIAESNFVLLMCTPNYKSKFDGPELKGGVAYEATFIRGEMTYGERSKFVVVLRSGEPSGSIPGIMRAFYWVDLRGEPYSVSQYRDLLRKFGVEPRPEYGWGGDCSVALVHIEARDDYRLARFLRVNLQLGGHSLEIIDRVRRGKIVELNGGLPLKGARKLWQDIRDCGAWASVSSPSIEATPHIVKSPTGLVLARIPAGEFRRRSEGCGRESSVVRIHRSFLMMTTPVTRQVFREVMGKVPPAQRNQESPLLPVTNVGWDDVMELCIRLSDREDLPKELAYRPPTEGEWELAARAGQNTEYSGSEAYNDVAWYEAAAPTIVAGRAPNDWGLCDMSGNVEELCLDHYQEEPAHGNNPVFELRDPKAPRVAKGGSYRSKPLDLRIASRTPAEGAGAPWLGIRLVRALP
jgi:formylglycine-generating enzyme required for sulfatase activity